MGSNLSRVLVEVDCDAELTFNVFVSDAKLMCSRYSFTVALSAKGGQPIATKIDNLLPGTNYAIYIGGITPAETATNNASFQTLVRFAYCSQLPYRPTDAGRSKSMEGN